QGAYRARFVEQLDQGRFDAIVCPPAALPALRHGDTAALPDYDSYARVFNVIGFPAGVVAAGRVRPDEESDRAPTRDGVLLRAGTVEQGSAGLPVGVQVAARPWREDVVLAVMAVLEAHFKQQPDYPLAER
ncbi:MAG TPA: amidase family protein, partial [Anaerolineales bacterium]|nr:amidase family protein [Anaerolineales bacterium]